MYNDIQVIAERLRPLQDFPHTDLLGEYWGGSGKVDDGFALPSYTCVSVAAVQEPKVETGRPFYESIPPCICDWGSPGRTFCVKVAEDQQLLIAYCRATVFRYFLMDLGENSLKGGVWPARRGVNTRNHELAPCCKNEPSPLGQNSEGCRVRVTASDYGHGSCLIANPVRVLRYPVDSLRPLLARIYPRPCCVIRGFVPWPSG